ncbi:calcineurin-like phosphoesterase family protein [Ureibacillus acetophenoni]|uniref:Calcineurin-like phosphoesterase family protein n=2 Tax=Ureibacillus acetophenoni TaxID=614649 RepID=A0A285UPT4_9BACL|nr:calcineurin-like phosphoesterase family protein [Ureibacillus acetophenoni]
MIGIGPDTNEVLHMLFSRMDLSMITGNHDEAILALAKGEEYPNNHPHVKVHHQWILNKMDPSFIPKLEQLLRTINQTIDGRSILFTHYQFKKGKLHEHISKNPFSSIVEPSLVNLESLFVDNNEDLICFGHHHPLHYFRGDKSIYLNPGSLGCNHKPTAPYAIVSVSNNEIEINLEEAPYDNTAFLDSYQKLKVPEREFILRVFHGNQI